MRNEINKKNVKAMRAEQIRNGLLAMGVGTFGACAGIGMAIGDCAKSVGNGLLCVGAGTLAVCDGTISLGCEGVKDVARKIRTRRK